MGTEMVGSHTRRKWIGILVLLLAGSASAAAPIQDGTLSLVFSSSSSSFTCDY